MHTPVEPAVESNGRPNKRVQRTRSSASPPHSPLTRHPLGATKGPFGHSVRAFAVFLCSAAAVVAQPFVGVPDPSASPVPDQLRASLTFLTPFGTSGPRVLVFSDGTIIYSLDKPEAEPRLMTGRLTDAERLQVERLLDARADFLDCQPFVNLAPGVHDLPMVELGLQIGATWKNANAYALVSKDYRPAAYFAAPTSQKPDVLPSSFSKLYDLLVDLSVQNTVVWKATFLELRFKPYDYSPEKPLHWPAGWPTPESKPGYDWEGPPGVRSVFVSAEWQDRLAEFLRSRREKQAILVNGRKMSIYWQAVVPGTELWRKLQSLQRGGA